MKSLSALTLLALLLAPVMRAEDVAKPTKTDIPTLIKQLGDDSPQTREDASQKLRLLGADALPALAEAAKSDDPEVVSRAEVITRQIDQDLHPKPAQPDLGGRSVLRLNRGGALVGPGAVQLRLQGMGVRGKSVSVSRAANGDTVRETTVTDAGQTITIREAPGEVAVTTTRQVDGKDVAETTKAKDLDALKKDSPKAFELYEKHAKPAAARIRVQGGVGGIDPDGNVDVEKILREARALSDEHRKMAEEQHRLAQEQLREARRLLEEQRQQQEQQR